VEKYDQIQCNPSPEILNSLPKQFSGCVPVASIRSMFDPSEKFVKVSKTDHARGNWLLNWLQTRSMCQQKLDLISSSYRLLLRSEWFHKDTVIEISLLLHLVKLESLYSYQVIISLKTWTQFCQFS